MNKKILRLIIFTALVVLFVSIKPTTVQAAEGVESYSGEVLCLPDVYQQTPSDCLPLGPSDFLTSMASKGIPIPFQPLPAKSSSIENTLTPFPYLKVGENSFPLYASLEDAEARNPSSYMEAGYKYLSIIQRQDLDSGVYYQLRNGFWIEGGEAYTECCIRSGRFQGLYFYKNPENSFGWLVDQAEVVKTPGYQFRKNGQDFISGKSRSDLRQSQHGWYRLVYDWLE